jgi:hypothetical protein
VIAVRHGFMSAIRPVDMARLMPSTQMTRRALHGVGTADFNPVLVDSIAVHVLQMAVLKIVHVTIVLHRFVAAGGSVNMSSFAWIDKCIAHRNSPCV